MTEAHAESFASGSGHPIVFWPGYGINPARVNGADLSPLPVQPVHFQRWTAMQYQLSNGWQQTNYGRKASYDDYLRLLQSSATGPYAPKPLPGQGLQPQGGAVPSRIQLQNQVAANLPTDNGNLGTGLLGPGVNLNGRRYYG